MFHLLIVIFFVLSREELKPLLVKFIFIFSVPLGRIPFFSGSEDATGSEGKSLQSQRKVSFRQWLLMEDLTSPSVPGMIQPFWIPYHFLTWWQWSLSYLAGAQKAIQNYTEVLILHCYQKKKKVLIEYTLQD